MAYIPLTAFVYIRYVNEVLKTSLLFRLAELCLVGHRILLSILGWPRTLYVWLKLSEILLAWD